MKPKMAQMPPMGGDPLAGGMGGGMPPMGGDPLAGGMGMGGPPMAPGMEEKQPIFKPIDSVGGILYDGDVDEIIASHPEADDDELARLVWEEYGGNPDGTVDPDKTGKRTDGGQEENPEKTQAEIQETENSRWERLPLGKTVADITSLDELVGLMSSLTFGVVKKYTAPEGEGGAGGGMGGMLAETKSSKMLRVAERLDVSAPDLARDIRQLIVSGKLR